MAEAFKNLIDASTVQQAAQQLQPRIFQTSSVGPVAARTGGARGSKAKPAPNRRRDSTSMAYPFGGYPLTAGIPAGSRD